MRILRCSVHVLEVVATAGIGEGVAYVTTMHTTTGGTAVRCLRKDPRFT